MKAQPVVAGIVEGAVTGVLKTDEGKKFLKSADNFVRKIQKFNNDIQRASRQAKTVNDRTEQEIEDACNILGVSQEDTFEDMRKVYLELAKLNHPDKNGGSEDAMRDINWAYGILSREFGN